MRFKTKQEYVDFVLNDENFKSSLINLSEEERQKVVAQARGFAERIADSFLNIQVNDELINALNNMLKRDNNV